MDYYSNIFSLYSKWAKIIIYSFDATSLSVVVFDKNIWDFLQKVLPLLKIFYPSFEKISYRKKRSTTYDPKSRGVKNKCRLKVNYFSIPIFHCNRRNNRQALPIVISPHCICKIRIANAFEF